MRKMYERVTCRDGFNVSIQASETSYCAPRANQAAAYSSVELGFPSDPCPFILKYAETVNDPTGSVYGYVPASVVRKMIAGHGGIVSGECPPLA